MLKTILLLVVSAWTLSGCAAGLAGCYIGLFGCERPTDPEPLKTSDLSVFDLGGEQGTLWLYYSSNALILVDGQFFPLSVNSATHRIFYGERTTDTRPSDTIVVYSSYDTSSQPVGTAVLTSVGTGRLDPIGGVVDGFSADVVITSNYDDQKTVSGVLILQNTDGAEGNGLNYSTIGLWSTDEGSLLLEDGSMVPFRIFGAMNLGDEINASYKFGPEDYIPISGSAAYAGYFEGTFVDVSGAASAAGNASFSIDFADQTVTGGLTDLTAGGALLRDVIFLPADPATEAPFEGYPYSYPGIAVTATGEGQTGPEMIGTYMVRAYRPQGLEAGGSTVLAGDGAALVGAFTGSQ